MREDGTQAQGWGILGFVWNYAVPIILSIAAGWLSAYLTINDKISEVGKEVAVLRSQYHSEIQRIAPLVDRHVIAISKLELSVESLESQVALMEQKGDISESLIRLQVEQVRSELEHLRGVTTKELRDMIEVVKSD